MQLRYTAKLDQIALCQNIIKEKHFYVKTQSLIGICYNLICDAHIVCTGNMSEFCRLLESESNPL